MIIAIHLSIEFDSISICKHILHFWDNLGQIWSKITQPRSQNKNLIFLSQNVSFQGKHTENLEFQHPSSKKWFLVLDSSKKLVFEFFVIGTYVGGFQFMNFQNPIGVPYHAPVVFFRGPDFLLKSTVAYCVSLFMHLLAWDFLQRQN